MNDEEFFERVKSIPSEQRGLFLALVAVYVAGIESGLSGKVRRARKVSNEESGESK